MSPTPREFVNSGRRTTESSQAKAARWLSGMLQTTAVRASVVPAFFRGRVRAELDALGVPTRSDLEAVASRAEHAVKTVPGTDVVAPVVPDDALGELRRELGEMRAAFQRGFQLLASRIDTVQRDSKLEAESLRRDLGSFAVEHRSGLTGVHDELAGVGRATRRDLERIRTEIIEMEAATRRDLERIAEGLALTGPRPALGAPRVAAPVNGADAPMTIAITPGPIETPVVVTPAAAPIEPVARTNGSGSASNPLTHQGGVITPTPTPTPTPYDHEAAARPAPPTAGAVPSARRVREIDVRDDSPAPATAPASRSGRWAPVWRHQDAPPVVDLGAADLEDPVPPSAAASRVPPPR